MRILYVVPWAVPYDETDLTKIISTQFGYYTIVAQGAYIMWQTHNRDMWFYKLCKKLRIPQQEQIFCQLSCISKAKDYDVVYVGFDMHLLPLAVCKMLGILRKPVFVLSHFSYSKKYTGSKWKKLYKRVERALVYSAFDKITFACDTLLRIAKEDYPVPQRHWNIADWGANMKFYDRTLFHEAPTNDYFVAAGDMNRDYATLIGAFGQISPQKAQIKIFSKYRDYTKGQAIPANVQFENLMNDYTYQEAYEKLRVYYYNSIAILLPIDYINDVPNGATVLVEVLAMGKPIVITEADTNYIDVEKEGVGLTVKRKDVDGWVRAINYLADNPDKAREMGERAYQLAKTKYNDELFSQNILRQMEDMIKK